MSFCFFPDHEHRCANVNHCPHLGGAALGNLVSLANENEEYHRYLQGTIDAERERNSRLFEENQRLQKELEQVKFELKLERQNKFATSQQKRDDRCDASQPASDPSSALPQPKKRGAPIGHPGWYRKTPSEHDWEVDVMPPKRCPDCAGLQASQVVNWRLKQFHSGALQTVPFNG